MKNLSILLAAVGVILLVLAAAGRILYNPYTIERIYSVQSVVAVANAALLLAILVKLYEKK